MSQTWNAGVPPCAPNMTLARAWRICRRALPMAVIVFGGALLFSALRLVERPIHGQNRPWTPYITRCVCRIVLRLLGFTLAVEGRPMAGPGAIVANHSSWLDIFVLGSADLIYFVSKAEVSRWPGIGWLARITGTLFIERDRRQARAQTEVLENRLRAGHRLLFFPEGTSTDNLRVLPFKTTLFAPFQSKALQGSICIQPVSLAYLPPPGSAQNHYGWWGDMGFAEHLIDTLSARRQGHVDILCHPPIALANFKDRKALASALETLTRDGHTALSANAKSRLP